MHSIRRSATAVAAAFAVGAGSLLVTSPAAFAGKDTGTVNKKAPSCVSRTLSRVEPGRPQFKITYTNNCGKTLNVFPQWVYSSGKLATNEPVAVLRPGRSASSVGPYGGSYKALYVVS